MLGASPLSFSQLKNELGMKSSGNLDHHLKKLGDLVLVDSNGLYKVSDDGEEALKAIRSLESSFAAKEAYPAAQSRRIFGVLLSLLAVFVLAVTIMAVSLVPSDMTSMQIVGLLGGLIGSIVGISGAALGLKGAIMADGKSSRELTYFPSQKDPWQVRDWVVHLTLLGSYLVSMFLLVYAQIFGPLFPYKPLWFMAGVVALPTLMITSILTSYRIVEKANLKIERSSYSLSDWKSG